MIITESYKVREDGVRLNRTYSDKGLKIKKVIKTWNGKRIQTNQVYDSAIDVEGAPYEYEETDIPIEIPEDNKGNIPE